MDFDSIDSMTCRELKAIYEELHSFGELCDADKKYLAAVKSALCERGYIA